MLTIVPGGARAVPGNESLSDQVDQVDGEPEIAACDLDASVAGRRKPDVKPRELSHWVPWGQPSTANRVTTRSRDPFYGAPLYLNERCRKLPKRDAFAPGCGDTNDFTVGGTRLHLPVRRR
jgi:hypothetical protein